MAAALILYPRYLDPITGQRCEVEQVLDIIAGQQSPAPRYRRLYMVGFSLWKRAFMRAFCQPLAEELRFVRKLPETLADDEQVLVWGSRHPERQNAIRVEDGFIRSRGWAQTCAALRRSPSTRWGSTSTAAVQAGWSSC